MQSLGSLLHSWQGRTDTADSGKLCETCGETPPVVFIFPGGTKQYGRCACDRRQAARERIDENKRKLEDRFRNAGLEPEYHRGGFGGFDVSEDCQALRYALGLARAVVRWENGKGPRPSKGLFIYGQRVGTGKTRLAQAILAYVLMRSGPNARGTTDTEAYRRIKATYSPDSSETYERVLDSLTCHRLIAWEDYLADQHFPDDLRLDFLETWRRNETLLVITSNWTPKQMADGGVHPRVYSRLFALVEPVPMCGTWDRRLERRQTFRVARDQDLMP